jgi:hypothetical protein
MLESARFFQFFIAPGQFQLPFWEISPSHSYLIQVVPAPEPLSQLFPFDPG